MKGQISVKRKLTILKYLGDNGNIRTTARHFSTATLTIQPSQIRKWKAAESTLKEKKKLSPSSKTLHQGPPVLHKALEKEVYDWIIKCHQDGVDVSTTDAIVKAKAVNPEFKNGSPKTLRYWVYQFLNRYNLKIVGRKIVVDESVQGTNENN